MFKAIYNYLKEEKYYASELVAMYLKDTEYKKSIKRRCNMTSNLTIEFKDSKTRKAFMEWFEENGHIRYQGDMDFSDVNPKHIVNDFYYDYKAGKISTE